MLLKKLHIKILSVALLVTLISYNAVDNRALPQQFATEYVEYTDASSVVASYSRLYHTQVVSISEYVVFDFQNYIKAYDAEQNLRFKVMSLKNNLLKEAQQKTSFLVPLITSSKGIHTSFI